MNTLNAKSVFFAGIGGISMSALAEIMLSRGVKVSGYDQSESDATRRLSELGAKIVYEFDRSAYDGVELVVYTNAIHSDDPVIAYPASIGIKCIRRGEFLGELMLMNDNRIGVAGTHGKSTTTGMISEIMMMESDPTILVGAVLPSINSTYRIGHGKDFIFEACEYMDSFLSFHPTIAAVLNIEHDHVDYFPTLDDVIKSFSEYISLVGEDGYAVVNADCKNSVKTLLGFKGHPFTFSVKSEKADIYAKNIAVDGGYPTFDAYIKGEFFAHIRLSIPGVFNVSNALAAIACAYLSGASKKSIVEGIGKYRGVKRRFETRGKLKNAIVVDDYAHHPDEIRATLSSARDLGLTPITVVFQSHTYTRTKSLFHEFCDAFRDADEVIYADIYPAREMPIEGITAEELAKNTANGTYVGNFGDIAAYLKENKQDGIILIMGAGDVIKITDMILEEK